MTGAPGRPACWTSVSVMSWREIILEADYENL